MTQPSQPTIDTLADLYASLGLSPTQADLQAALVSLKATLAAAAALDAIVPLEIEPVPAFLPPAHPEPAELHP